MELLSKEMLGNQLSWWKDSRSALTVNR
jgi:hypothetical protein